jgi:heptosyltransferase I
LGFRKSLKKSVNSVLAVLFKRPKLSAEQLLSLTPDKILIVRQHNQMGDMICATPAFRAIRNTYQDAQITLVCAPVNYDSVRNNPDVNQVIVFDKCKSRNPFNLFKLIKLLRASRPDLAFVLNSVSYSVTSSALAVVSGSNLIVGNDSIPFGFDITRHIYSLELPSFPDVDRNTVLHNLAPLQAIGITTIDLSTVSESSESEIRQANKFLEALPKPIWTIHPGAGKTQNIWPVDRYAKIADNAVQMGVSLIVLQGPADHKVIEEFKNIVKSEVCYAPIMPAGACAEILKQSERFLCNDTSLMHLAGSVGVPSLALFGATDPKIWGPLNKAVSCIRGSDGVLSNLETDFVWKCWLNLSIREDDK